MTILPGDEADSLRGNKFTVVATGILIGGCIGGMSGLVFGSVGGAIGGPAGWIFAGFIGAFAFYSIVTPGGYIEWFGFIPASILAVIGLFIGLGQVSGSSAMPLTRWLHRLWKQAYPLHQSLRVRVSIGLLGFFGGIVLVTLRSTLL
jgi:hypothetical protein